MPRRALLAAALVLAACRAPTAPPRACDADESLQAVQRWRANGYLGQALRDARSAQRACPSTATERALADILADIGLTGEAVAVYGRYRARAGAAEQRRVDAVLAELRQRPPPTRQVAAADRDRALALFRDGVNLRLLGRHADAVRQLRRSYALLPHPLTIVQIGEAHRAAGDLTEARRAFARALAIAELLADAPASPVLGSTHDSDATVMQLARNDRWLLIMDEDARVVVWDAHTGRMVNELVDRTGTTAALSPDGALLALGHGDGRVVVRDTATGTRVAELRAGEARVTGLAFARSGTRLAAGTAAGLVQAWASDGWAVTATQHGAPVVGIAFAAGDRLVTTGADGSWRLWSGERLAPAGAGTVAGRTGALALSPAGDRVVVATDQGIHWIDPAGGTEVRSITAEGSPPTCAAFVGDDVLMIAHEELPDADARDARTGAALSGAARHIRVSQGAGCVAGGSASRLLAVSMPMDSPHIVADVPAADAWTRDERPSRQLGLRFERPATIRFVAGGGLLAASSTVGLRLWAGSAPLSSGHLTLDRLEVTGDGLVAAGEPALRDRRGVLSYRPGASWTEQETHGAITAMALSPSGRWADASVFRLVVGGIGEPGRTVARWDAQSPDAAAVALSHDGARVAIAWADGNIDAWAVDGTWHQRLDRGARNAGLVFVSRDDPARPQVAFSPDATRLAWGDGGDVEVWDLASARRLFTAARDPAQLSSLAYSPDGDLLAAADWAGTVWAWDPASGEARFRRSAAGGRVRDLAFSADGRRLATAGKDGAIQLIDAVSGAAIGVLAGNDDRWLAIAADGRVDGSRNSADSMQWRVGDLMLPGPVGWQRQAEPGLLRELLGDAPLDRGLLAPPTLLPAPP